VEAANERVKTHFVTPQQAVSIVWPKE
jgi:hypothetical protein